MNWKYIVGGVLTVAALTFVIWLLFFRTTTKPTTPAANGGLFGASQNQQVPTISNSSSKTEAQQTFVYSPTQKKVFMIAEGPVAGAVFTQTRNPTTTSARYVRQDSGHVYEQPLDTTGSAARLLSNTTIPGVRNTVWTQFGSSVILQYTEGDTIKTVSVAFQPAAATTTSTSQSVLRFLPDNIQSIAASPDGKRIVYLLKTTTGADGYIANYNGTNPIRLFSMPLSQIIVTWPSLNQLLVQTKEAAGVPGMAFTVPIKTGVYSALLYTTGLTTTVNGNFSSIVYQTDANGKKATYEHDVATGKDTKLSGQPIPEKCAWSYVARAVLICAVPTSYTDINYLDLWHQGAASVADILVGYNFDTEADVAIATPGEKDGGEKADIASLGVSPNGDYVLYTTRGNRSLWGVRLTQ